MAQSMAHTAEGAFEAERSHAAHQAYHLLHVAFVVVPIIAGIDKFLHILTNWDQYLAPWVVNLSPISKQSVMLWAGLIEIIAGILVAIKPRIFAYVVALWLLWIIIDLVSMGSFYDIALRDFGLLLGALALGRLSAVFNR